MLQSFHVQKVLLEKKLIILACFLNSVRNTEGPAFIKTLELTIVIV